MKIYNYNSITKQFTSAALAKDNPRDPKHPLIPANATVTEPLEPKAGYAVCFNETHKKWERLVDKRGIWYDANGDVHTIAEIGIASETGWTKAPPPPKPLTATEQVLLDIRTLEAEISPRRIREALLATDNGWLQAQDAKIATLRDKLKA